MMEVSNDGMCPNVIDELVYGALGANRERRWTSFPSESFALLFAPRMLSGL
jgi:hypothetical protein